MARRYNRDSRGRFASGGGGGGSRRPAPRGISRGTNRLTRDNSGRITSVGGDGATARGGRLRTASGNQRATQTARISGGRAAGTTAKPRGLKPESSRKLRTGVAVNRMRSINERMGNRPDIAEQNIRGRFRGQAGKRFDARIDRAVKQVKAAQTAALMKPKAQVKAERAAAAEAKRQAAAAKPKRTRTPESLRMSRAKQIEKRRSITTNPAGERASSAAKMAANAARTQERATAFLKAGGKANPTTRAAAAAVKPVRRPSRSQMITPEKTRRIAQRVNQVTANAASKSGVKRLNSTEVGVRAKSFLTKKAGGMAGVKSFEQQQAVIGKALAKPTRYSTQKPNRNKPGAYNNLGQANVRRKMNAADKSNNSALASKTVKAANIRANATPQPARMQTRSQGPKAPDTVRTRVNRLRVTQARVRMERIEPDSLRFSRAVQSRNEALRARPAGTSGKFVFRGRNRAVNRQNMQANDLTSRVRMDLRNARPGAFSATAGGGRTGIRRTDTGNRQLSLMGQPATKLYQTKRTKINRPSGKRRS